MEVPSKMGLFYHQNQTLESNLRPPFTQAQTQNHDTCMSSTFQNNIQSYKTRIHVATALLQGYNMYVYNILYHFTY